MNRTDLQVLAQTRIREARILFEAGEFSGAYYLAGYAVECALKAVVALQTMRFDFPDKQHANNSFTHDLNKLSEVARLTKQLNSAGEINPVLRRNWQFVVGWSESTRYLLHKEDTARAMLDAVADQADGVLSWIMQFW